MAREFEAESERPVGERARVHHSLAAVVVANLVSPVAAWGAGSQQQWAVADQQGLIFTGLKMVGALALILGLMLLSLHFLKRYRLGMNRRSPESQVQILDVRMLAPKKSIALVEVAGERLLLGVGTETVTMLSRFDSQPQQLMPEAETAGPGFAKTLLNTLRRRSQGDSEAGPTSANPVGSAEGQMGAKARADAEIRGHGETEKKQLSMLK
jgi:flagellar biosynthetic protein FliO